MDKNTVFTYEGVDYGYDEEANMHYAHKNGRIIPLPAKFYRHMLSVYHKAILEL